MKPGRGRPPKQKKTEEHVQCNGSSVDDVYHFNAEIEDGSQKHSDDDSKSRRHSARIALGKEIKEDKDEESENKCALCGREFQTAKGMKRHFRACEKNGSIKCEKEEAEIDDPAPVSESDHVEFQTADQHLTINGNIVIADMSNVNDLEVPDYNEDSCDEDNVSVKRDPACLIEDGKCDCCGEDIDDAHENGNFGCDDCNISFKEMSGLLRHRIITHNEGETYKCDKCTARCPDEQTLKNHMVIHNNSNSGIKPVSCPVCHKQFSRKYHLIRHNMQTGCDGSPKPSFPCQVCLRVFSRKDNLREHLRAHAGQTKRKKVYTCEFCNKECTGNSMLIQHKKMHTGDKPHMCDICPKRFPSSGALKKHRRKHTGERPYECKQCYARFAAKETLNRHTRIHTGVKPHSCLFCGKRFIQASQLRAHIFHHTGENGFHCKECGQAFNRRTRLDLHVKYVHEGAKPFDCEECGRTFVRKEDLARHQILHSGVKAHKCPICEKGFAMKSSLKIHLLTHTKEPPRSCDECGRAFIRQDCLLRHMRTKHRDKLEEIMAEAEKKKLQAQLLAVAAANTIEDDDSMQSNDLPSFMSDEALTDSISQLLTLLVDETTLKSFGWPGTSVDKLLECVIRRCGHSPTMMEDLSYSECLRENAKLLFTVVIDDTAVKTLLNNQTVDEVILHVLKLAKA